MTSRPGSTPSLGPAPVPAVPPLGAARRRVLQTVAAAGDAGVTVSDVAGQLGGHPNASRTHLDGLAANGLVAITRAEPDGRGRPALRFTITGRGQQTLRGAGPDYRLLAAAFARHLAAHGEAGSARSVGAMWAETLAPPTPAPAPGPGPDAVPSQLLELFSGLDFSPEVVHDPEGDTQILLHTCPFVEEARTNRTVICGVHQGLIDGSLAAWGQTAGVDLQPFSGPGTCRVLLSPPRQKV